MRILVMLVILGSLLSKHEESQAAPPALVATGCSIAVAAALSPALGPLLCAGYACSRDD